MLLYLEKAHNKRPPALKKADNRDTNLKQFVILIKK